MEVSQVSNKYPMNMILQIKSSSSPWLQSLQLQFALTATNPQIKTYFTTLERKMKMEEEVSKDSAPFLGSTSLFIENLSCRVPDIWHFC